MPATTATSAIPGTSTSAAVSKNQNAILDELWRLFLELERVRIITWRVLRDFMEKWPAAIVPLREWYKVTQCATWRSFADVKATFGQTDHARVKSGQTVCIFDIGGNKFRLVAFVSYAKGKVYVLRVMTHKEYGRANQRWKDEL